MCFKILLTRIYVLCSLVLFRLQQCTSGETCFTEDSQTWRCNYIPKDIPAGFPRVRLIQFYRQNTPHMCHYSFKSANWSNIKYLELRDDGFSTNVVMKENCLIGLESLEELSFNIGCENITLEPGAFRGLTSVTILNMSDCFRMPTGKLSTVFERKDELPNIKTLSINKMNAYKSHVSLNEQFCKSMLPRQIDYFEFRGLSVDEVNVVCFAKSFKKSVTVHMSSSVLALITGENLIQSDMQHFKVLDFSYSTPPKALLNIPPGKFVIIDNKVSFKSIDPRALKLLFTPQVINYNGVTPSGVTFWFYNFTIDMDRDPKWLVKTLHLQENGIRRADIRFNCLSKYSFPTLEHVDAARNGLEFIHPSLLSCIRNMKFIDISFNNLYKMLDENITLFGNMFASLKQLKTVLLASNKLHHLPLELFDRNVEIEVIDLSNNNLEQLVIKVMHLSKLKLLNLRNNKIKILDMTSLNSLDSIPRSYGTGGHPKIVLGSNPISCDRCKAKTFLKWILKTDLINITAQKDLYCKSENGTYEQISQNMYKQVLNICLRETIRLAACIASACVTIVLVLAAVITYRHRKRVQRRRNKERIKRLVTEGEGQYEFVVMLTFSSEDADFVYDNVAGPLNEHLGLLFPDAERNLILTGDRHFRPGFYVHEEISASLERASVVVVVVSRNYCESHYCKEELDQAYILKKPVILMFKEHVDIQVMMPTMKVLYKKYVRILWGEENGKYFLKTTWENVCRSVRDLMLK